MAIIAFSNLNSKFCFVPHPAIRGHYVRCDPSVLVVKCPFCKSEKGIPCHGRITFTSSTHRDRVKAALNKRLNVKSFLCPILVDNSRIKAEN